MLRVRAAQPSLTMDVTERLTAFQARLLKMTKRTGRSWARETQCAAVGEPKM